MASIHHPLHESCMNGAIISTDLPQRRSEILQKRIHIGPGRTTVNTDTGTPKVELPGMASSTGETEVVLALILIFYEPDRQRVGVAQRGLLWQVTVIIQVFIGTEKLGCARLL